jgi:FKBP-type peptidyl-prolyl cis-trans isomerase
MPKPKNQLAMKKNHISFLFPVLLVTIGMVACDTQGVKEKETVTVPEKKDSTPVENTIAQTSIDSQAVNFDTAFNFAAKKPVDSLVLPSGVKLKYLHRGTGNKINKYDVVAINYRGMLPNGKLIESNEVFGKPVPFVVGIKMTFDAFDEVLQKCKTGDKIRFIIPAAKAYGEKGRGNVIPPNTDLVYEMDIIEKVKGKKTPSGVEYFSLYQKGSGTQPVTGDKVSITYMGWVKKTGHLFDASASTGKLYEFILGNGVAIKAWHEAVAKMHQGEKIMILAPAVACYGSKGVPELVPPNSDLIYLIELKEVEKAK